MSQHSIKRYQYKPVKNMKAVMPRSSVQYRLQTSKTRRLLSGMFRWFGSGEKKQAVMRRNCAPDMRWKIGQLSSIPPYRRKLVHASFVALGLTASLPLDYSIAYAPVNHPPEIPQTWMAQLNFDTEIHTTSLKITAPGIESDYLSSQAISVLRPDIAGWGNIENYPDGESHASELSVGNFFEISQDKKIAKTPSTQNSITHTANETSNKPQKTIKISAETKSPSVSTTTTSKAKWRIMTVKSGDNVSTLFKRNNLNQGDLINILKLGKAKRLLRALQPGQELRVQADKDGHIQAMCLTLFKSKRELHIISEGKKGPFTALLRGQGDPLTLKKKIKQVQGTLKKSSFNKSTKKAGLPDPLHQKLVNIFGWTLDIEHALKSGDRFKVVYEQYQSNGQAVKDGNILAAEIYHQGKAWTAVRYTDARGHSAYYSPQGISLKPAFHRHPVKNPRITSHFNLKRRHPILKIIRPHKGTDYGTKSGTPIYAVADGKVESKSWKGGYGRTIVLEHGNKYSTLYAHMSRYGKGLKAGQRVKQGQIIGYVGHSGLASSSHLHYELHVDGAAKNAYSTKLPQSGAIKATQLADFKKHANTLLAQLKSSNVQVAMKK
ncbi:M23 family metallopeptidase [Candidatus Venteria ishoeyi]|uniref:Murein DD-endopeptidase MepM n=1 Tax=Candidatus Venteria ishoeyi TaxID=1899563 RepID=A0A1H6FGC2_9GAMM|nr:peptidoglycan DD-metalloendopeptidase family protein [Candidatus Venteria ishoeyi]SEH08703.1 Murein DD-endopeptidase MepM [Candidatus Venteria ishoeyi]